MLIFSCRMSRDIDDYLWYGINRDHPRRASKGYLFKACYGGSRPPGLAFGSYSKASREVKKVYSGNGEGSRCSLRTHCW